MTRFVDRSDVAHVEAHGDYARLHTAGRAHLIRVPLATLEEEWAGAGFVRIHRSLLVALRHITEVRMESGRCTVAVGARGCRSSRRHTRELRDLLRSAGRPAGEPRRDRHAPRAGPGDRTAPAPHAPLAGAGEIDEQTAARRGLHRSLLREQLALAARILRPARAHRRRAAPALPRLPRPGRRRGARLPLAWLLLGVLVYPCPAAAAGASYAAPSATSATSPPAGPRRPMTGRP